MLIYKVTYLPTGHVYVGQTKRSLTERWDQHIRKAKSIDISDANRFQRVLKSNPIESFEVEILETCGSDHDLNEAEKRWIAFFESKDPSKGFNLTSGGQRGDLTSEARKKISTKLRGKTKSDVQRQKLSEIGKTKTGEKNSFFGKHHTVETIKRISESMQGEKGPCYGRTKEKHPMFGKHHTNETRQKISNKHKGRPLSPQHVEAIKRGHEKRRVITRERDQKIIDLLQKGMSRQQIAVFLNVKMNLIYGAICRFNRSKQSASP